MRGLIYILVELGAESEVNLWHLDPEVVPESVECSFTKSCYEEHYIQCLYKGGFFTGNH